MNFPQQPFPGQSPQPNGPMGPATGTFQPPFQTTQPGFPNVAGAAQANTFAQMLNEPPRQRRNREKIADGTHVVQFTLETQMNTSQTTLQPYLLVSYNVIESSVPQMVHKTFNTPMMLNNRGSVQALAEMTKVIFGMDYATQLANSNPAPLQIAQLLAQHLVNRQTGQGLFALLTTWRSRKGKNGAPPPSYDEAFVNHDWLLASQQQFTLAQASQAGHRVPTGAPPAQQQWGTVPPAPAQQNAFPAPSQAAPQQQPQQNAFPAPPQSFVPAQQPQQNAFPAPPQQNAFPAPPGLPPIQK